MNVVLYNPKEDRTKVSKWVYVSVCSECYGRLSDTEKYYGSGICPHCGYDSDSTICDDIKCIYRKVYTYVPEMWKFWKDSEYFIEAKDDDSHQALLKMHI